MTKMNWSNAKKPARVDPQQERQSARLENWATRLLAATGFEKPKPKRRAKKTPNRRRSKP